MLVPTDLTSQHKLNALFNPVLLGGKNNRRRHKISEFHSPECIPVQHRCKASGSCFREATVSPPQSAGTADKNRPPPSMTTPQTDPHHAPSSYITTPQMFTAMLKNWWCQWKKKKKLNWEQWFANGKRQQNNRYWNRSQNAKITQRFVFRENFCKTNNCVSANTTVSLPMFPFSDYFQLIQICATPQQMHTDKLRFVGKSAIRVCVNLTASHLEKTA